MAQRVEGNLRRNHDVTRKDDVKSLSGFASAGTGRKRRYIRGTGRKRRANGSFVANRDELVDCVSVIECSDSEAIPMPKNLDAAGMGCWQLRCV